MEILYRASYKTFNKATYIVIRSNTYFYIIKPDWGSIEEKTYGEDNSKLTYLSPKPGSKTICIEFHYIPFSGQKRLDIKISRFKVYQNFEPFLIRSVNGFALEVNYARRMRVSDCLCLTYPQLLEFNN